MKKTSLIVAFCLAASAAHAEDTVAEDTVFVLRRSADNPVTEFQAHVQCLIEDQPGFWAPETTLALIHASGTRNPASAGSSRPAPSQVQQPMHSQSPPPGGSHQQQAQPVRPPQPPPQVRPQMPPQAPPQVAPAHPFQPPQAQPMPPVSRPQPPLSVAPVAHPEPERPASIPPVLRPFYQGNGQPGSGIHPTLPEPAPGLHPTGGLFHDPVAVAHPAPVTNPAPGAAPEPAAGTHPTGGLFHDPAAVAHPTPVTNPGAAPEPAAGTHPTGGEFHDPAAGAHPAPAANPAPGAGPEAGAHPGVGGNPGHGPGPEAGGGVAPAPFRMPPPGSHGFPPPLMAPRGVNLTNITNVNVMMVPPPVFLMRAPVYWPRQERLVVLEPHPVYFAPPPLVLIPLFPPPLWVPVNQEVWHQPVIHPEFINVSVRLNGNVPLQPGDAEEFVLESRHCNPSPVVDIRLHVQRSAYHYAGELHYLVPVQDWSNVHDVSFELTPVADEIPALPPLTVVTHGPNDPIVVEFDDPQVSTEGIQTFYQIEMKRLVPEGDPVTVVHGEVAAQAAPHQSWTLDGDGPQHVAPNEWLGPGNRYRMEVTVRRQAADGAQQFADLGAYEFTYDADAAAPREATRTANFEHLYGKGAGK